jgi:hypothetical protein
MQAVYENLDAVPEGLRAEYEEKDGKAVLKIEGDHPTVLAVVADANKKVGDFRNTNIGLKQENEALKQKANAFAGFDPVKIKEDQDKLRALEAKGVKGTNDVAEIVKQAVNAAVTPLNEKFEASERARQENAAKLATKTLESRITAAGVAAGVSETALPDFVSRGTRNFAVDGDTIVAKQPDGTPLYSKQRPGELLSVEEWATGLQAEAPHLFKPSTGADVVPGRPGGGVTPPGSVDANDMRGFSKNLKEIAAGKVKVVNQ